MTPTDTVEEQPPTDTTALKDPVTDPEIAAMEREADAAIADTALDAVGATELPPAAESHEVPIHRVLCQADGCKCGATYRPTSSGTGVMVLERYGMDIETALGMGPTGRPLCPNGHGEMAFADEQLPIEQAIGKVNERLEAKKRAPRLPFPAPPFNYEAVFHEIVEKRHEVAALEEKYEERKAAAKKAKDALDEANLQLGQMIESFEEREAERRHEIARRQHQADAGHPDGTTLLHCTFEQKYPDKDCEMCQAVPDVVQRILRRAPAPRDAASHVDDALAFHEGLAVEAVADALENIQTIVRIEVIAGWTPEERASVETWANAMLDRSSGADVVVPERPRILGTGHVASKAVDGQDQCCSQCDQVLIAAGADATYIETGRLVGTDCKGRKKEPNRYPERKGKKTTARASKPPAPAKQKAAIPARRKSKKKK